MNGKGHVWIPGAAQLYGCTIIATLIMFRTGDSSPIEATKVLFDGGDNFQEFFTDFLGTTAFRLDDSSRENREVWTKLHRTFLRGEDVDGLLQSNASIHDETLPLALGSDLDIWKLSQDETGQWGRRSVQSFSRTAQEALESSTQSTSRQDKNDEMDQFVDHKGVHQAFSDGYELVFHGMEGRSRTAFDMVDGLTEFWRSPAKSALHFMPPGLSKVNEHVPIFYPEESILVLLDGELDVNIIPDAYRFPYPDHIEDPDLRADVSERMRTTKPDVFHLVEGDLLYVPRGFSVDPRTRGKVALFMRMSVETYRRSVADVLVEAVNQAATLDNDTGFGNPLQEFAELEAKEANPSRIRYLDIVKVAVRVASEVTPELRSFLRIGPHMQSALEDAGVESPDVLLRRHLDSFLEAGGQALFAPMLEVLGSANGDKSSMSPLRLEDSESEAIDNILRWALMLTEPGAERPRRRAEDMFKLCLQYVREHGDEALALAQSSVEAREEARAESGRRARHSKLIASLRRHGQNVTGL